MTKLLKAAMVSAFITLLAPSAAIANGYEYQPEGCDFIMTLPSEPADLRSCHPQQPEKCETVQGFTKVFDMQATINMYISCRPAGNIERNQFNSDLMNTMLIAQPGVVSLETYDTTFTESDLYSVGGLIGAGVSPSGNDVMIYAGSIWVSDQSILTVRGELIGAEYEEADMTFAQILRDIRHVSDEDQRKEAEAATKQETGTTQDPE